MLIRLFLLAISIGSNWATFQTFQIPTPELNTETLTRDSPHSFQRLYNPYAEGAQQQQQQQQQGSYFQGPNNKLPPPQRQPIMDDANNIGQGPDYADFQEPDDQPIEPIYPNIQEPRSEPNFVNYQDNGSRAPLQGQRPQFNSRPSNVQDFRPQFANYPADQQPNYPNNIQGQTNYQRPQDNFRPNVQQQQEFPVQKRPNFAPIGGPIQGNGPINYSPNYQNAQRPVAQPPNFANSLPTVPMSQNQGNYPPLNVQQTGSQPNFQFPNIQGPPQPNYQNVQRPIAQPNFANYPNSLNQIASGSNSFNQDINNQRPQPNFLSIQIVPQVGDFNPNPQISFQQQQEFPAQFQRPAQQQRPQQQQQQQQQYNQQFQSQIPAPPSYQFGPQFQEPRPFPIKINERPPQQFQPQFQQQIPQDQRPFLRPFQRPFPQFRPLQIEKPSARPTNFTAQQNNSQTAQNLTKPAGNRTPNDTKPTQLELGTSNQTVPITSPINVNRSAQAVPEPANTNVTMTVEELHPIRHLLPLIGWDIGLNGTGTTNQTVPSVKNTTMVQLF